MVKKEKEKPIKTTGLTAGKAASEEIPVEEAAGGTASCAEMGFGPSTKNCFYLKSERGQRGAQL